MLASSEQDSGAPVVKREAQFPGVYMEMYCKPSSNGATSKSGRRFSHEQIKSLQYMFESESRPEPRMKEQLANHLGLQPRQIAIWFQNKRARSKGKRMMQDYCVLKANYDDLASAVESLKRENHLLHAKVQELRNMLENSEKMKQDEDRNEDEDMMSESKDKPRTTMEGRDNKIGTLVGDGNSSTVESIKEDLEDPNMVEKRDDTLSSSGNWCSLDSNSYLDESGCTSHWWGFWP